MLIEVFLRCCPTVLRLARLHHTADQGDEGVMEVEGTYDPVMTGDEGQGTYNHVLAEDHQLGV